MLACFVLSKGRKQITKNVNKGFKIGSESNDTAQEKYCSLIQMKCLHIPLNISLYFNSRL